MLEVMIHMGPFQPEMFYTSTALIHSLQEMHRHENSNYSQWMGWTLGLCRPLHALGKHHTFQKSWLCQRQTMKPNPLPQASTETKPPGCPEGEILCNALPCCWEVPERQIPRLHLWGEKKKKIEEASKEDAALKLSNYSLRHKPNHGNGSPSAKPNTCMGSPCGVPAIAWLSLTLPALLSRPFCRKISFTAQAKSHPGLADTLTALNHPPACPSGPGATLQAQGSRALPGEASGGRCRQAQISSADRKVINTCD